MGRLGSRTTVLKKKASNLKTNQRHEKKRQREKRILDQLTPEQQLKRKKEIRVRVKKTEVKVRAASLAAKKRKL